MTLKIGELAHQAIEAVRAEALEKLAAAAPVRGEPKTELAFGLRKLAEDLRSKSDEVTVDDLAEFVRNGG